MTTTADDARAAYADTLAHLTSRIVGAVHDDGPDATARLIDLALAEPAPAGVDPAQAVIAVLAAQVSPDATPSERFGWVNGPATAAMRHQRDDEHRLSVLLNLTWQDGPVRLPDYDTRLARVVDGLEPLSVLPPEYAAAAVEILRRRGMSAADTAIRVHASPSTVKDLRTRYARDEACDAATAPARAGQAGAAA